MASHWTICGISLQALAFFFANAIQGGSSCGRAGVVRPRGPGGPADLDGDFSGVVLDAKAGDGTGVVLGVEVGFEGGILGGFGWTGTGVGGGRDFWGGLGCFATGGGTCGFGATGQGSSWDLKGWEAAEVWGESALLGSFSGDTGGLTASGLTTEEKNKML